MNVPHPPAERHHSAEKLLPAPMRRFIPILGVIGVTLAAVGFLIGIHEPAERPGPSPVAASTPTAWPAAVGYADLPAAKLQPNADKKTSLSDLRFDKPGLFEEVKRTDAMKLEALADRARNRAYDGAPPTVPHPIASLSAASCLACHGEGMKVGDRVATKMSHAHLSNCTQCHVEQADQTVENFFLGVGRAGPGERANPGAPPTIPHHLWMREDCMSCHGLVARPGIRTTHPWLSNCMQCHAASSVLDAASWSGGSR